MLLATNQDDLSPNGACELAPLLPNGVPQDEVDANAPLGDYVSPTTEELPAPVPHDKQPYQDEVETTPRSSSLFRRSCRRLPRRFWSILLLLVVLVIAISVGALIVQRMAIFKQVGTGFKQVGSDLNGDPTQKTAFGQSVALSSNGTRVAIGGEEYYREAVGHVGIYDWTGSQWTQVGSDLISVADRDDFGRSVALSSDGTRVAIGAPWNDCDVGQVRIYDWTKGQWTQVGSSLNGETQGDMFGSRIALSSDGTRVAIGIPTYDENAGHVRVYDWTGGQWAQVGSDWNGEAAGRNFGSIVALSSDGTRLAIGGVAYGKYGYVRIYEWTGSQWTQVGSDLNGEADGDSFVLSVSLSSDGTRVAIGAPKRRRGDHSGYVRVYDWTGGQWTQVGSDWNGEAAGHNFGSSVALSCDGTRVAIGGAERWKDGVGHVGIYDWTGSQWKQVGSDLECEAAADSFGWSVALSSDGTRVAIGAPFGPFNGGARSGHVRVYDVSA